MKAKVVFVANLLLGAGLLVFILVRYGAPALATLGADVSIPAMAGFWVAAAATLVSLAWRWGWILGGLCTPPRLMRLTLYRSAAHSLAVLVPSGKVGGDPLRAWLAARDRVAPGAAIASVAVDRTVELATTSPFSLVFAALLLQHGIPQLERALITIGVATVGLIAGITFAARRLRRGVGLVAPFVQRMRLDRLGIVNRRMDVLAESDAAAAELVGHPRRLLAAFVAGLVTNLLVIGEFALLLAAFGLPTEPTAVVAAIFATGAAHMLPIPAGIGVLEGANMWLFHMLGYPTDVGLAVGLAARLRELIWMLPGVIYLLAGSIRSTLSGTRGA